MRFIIEIYDREKDGFVAVAGYEGQDIAAVAGVGADPSERRTIIGAVHSYFNRKEQPAAVVVHEPHPADESWMAEQERLIPRRVYTDESSIKLALSGADDGSQVFQMVYRDQGGNLTERRITVSKVEDRHRGVAGFPETYLVAYDLDKDEPRTFRVDRIERLEAI